MNNIIWTVGVVVIVLFVLGLSLSETMSGSTGGAGHRGLVSKRFGQPARWSGGRERPCLSDK
jgi:hypothetical protein